jgi:hypothetical protein
MGYIASPHLNRAERGLLADRNLAQRLQVGALRVRNPHRQARVQTDDGGVDLLDVAHTVQGKRKGALEHGRPRIAARLLGCPELYQREYEHGAHRRWQTLFETDKTTCCGRIKSVTE